MRGATERTRKPLSVRSAQARSGGIPGRVSGDVHDSRRTHGARHCPVRAAGDRRLDAGYYAYTGSAFGAGGLGRVDRHREVAAGDRDVRHWHVDHLLDHPETRFVDAHTTEREDRECAVARALSDACTPVPGLGASDCDCDTHLAYCPDRGRLLDVVRDAHG